MQTRLYDQIYAFVPLYILCSSRPSPPCAGTRALAETGMLLVGAPFARADLASAAVPRPGSALLAAGILLTLPQPAYSSSRTS